MLRQLMPAPALANYVKEIWAVERDFSALPDGFEITPDSYVELVFSFGEGCAIEVGGVSRPMPRGFLLGLLDAPVRFRAAGLVRTVAARFYAWGFYPLFRRDMSGLVNQVQALDAEWGQVADQLTPLVHAGQLEAAMARLGAYLLGQAGGQARDRATATRKLFEPQGGTSVEDMAVQANLSRRQLERQFNQTVGVSPKNLARKVRFERVRDHLWRHPDASLAALAAEHGYADQAHLTREFKQFAGRTPGQVAAELAATRDLLRAYHVAIVQDRA